jgi:hypothetical protein
LAHELFQLRILYQKSRGTRGALEASIQTQLKIGQAEVERKHQQLHALEHDRQVCINEGGLEEWLQENERQASDEGWDLILEVAQCQRELQEVSKAGGPLDQARKIFDAWWVTTASRRSKRGKVDDPLGLRNEESAGATPVGHLHSASHWLALMSSVEDRLRACAASLASLPRSPGSSSSIHGVIEMHKALSEQLLQEVEVCRGLKGLTEQEHSQWVQAAVEGALDEAELHHCAGGDAGRPRRAIWEIREAAR